jgi:hypothetical protein
MVLRIHQGSRISRRLPSPGSGYTILMAKHLACGSILFAQNSRWVKSIYITDQVLNALMKPKNIKDIQAYGGPSLELLRRLPAEKEIDAYYGISEESDIIEEMENEKNWLNYGLILRPNRKGNNLWRPVAQWYRIAVGIAFGGLVPQVAKNVAELVKFTVGLSPNPQSNTRSPPVEFGNCVEELESLINTLHAEEEQSDLFEEHVTLRCKARELVDYVNYTVPGGAHGDPRNAAAIFARYMTLLERICARHYHLPSYDDTSGKVTLSSSAISNISNNN